MEVKLVRVKKKVRKNGQMRNRIQRIHGGRYVTVDVEELERQKRERIRDVNDVEELERQRRERIRDASATEEEESRHITWGQMRYHEIQEYHQSDPVTPSHQQNHKTAEELRQNTRRQFRHHEIHDYNQSDPVLSSHQQSHGSQFSPQEMHRNTYHDNQLSEDTSDTARVPPPPSFYLRRFHSMELESSPTVVKMSKQGLPVKIKTRRELKLFRTTPANFSWNTKQPAAKICAVLKNPVIRHPPKVYVGRLPQQLDDQSMYLTTDMPTLANQCVGFSQTPTTHYRPASYLDSASTDVTYTPVEKMDSATCTETKRQRKKRILNRVFAKYPPKIYHYDFSIPEAHDSSATPNCQPPSQIVGVVKRLTDSATSLSSDSMEISERLKEEKLMQRKKSVENSMIARDSDSFENLLSTYDSVCSDLLAVVGPKKFEEMEADVTGDIMSSSLGTVDSLRGDKATNQKHKSPPVVSWNRPEPTKDVSKKKVRRATPEKQNHLFDPFTVSSEGQDEEQNAEMDLTLNSERNPVIRKPPKVYAGRLPQQLYYQPMYQTADVPTLANVSPKTHFRPASYFDSASTDVTYTPVEKMDSVTRTETKRQRKKRILNRVFEKYPPKIYHYDFSIPEPHDPSATPNCQPPSQIVGVVKRLTDSATSVSSDSKELSESLKEEKQRRKSVENSMLVRDSESFENLLSTYDKVCNDLLALVGPKKFEEMEADVTGDMMSSSLGTLDSVCGDKATKLKHKSPPVVSWDRPEAKRDISKKRVRIATPEKQVHLFDPFSVLSEGQDDDQDAEMDLTVTSDSSVVDSVYVEQPIQHVGLTRKRSNDSLNLDIDLPLDPPSQAQHSTTSTTTHIPNTTASSYSETYYSKSMFIATGLPYEPLPQAECPMTTNTTTIKDTTSSSVSRDLDKDDENTNTILVVPKVLWQIDLSQASNDIATDSLLESATSEWKQQYLSMFLSSQLEQVSTFSHVSLNKIEGNIGQTDNVCIKNIIHRCGVDLEPGINLHHADYIKASVEQNVDRSIESEAHSLLEEVSYVQRKVHASSLSLVTDISQTQHMQSVNIEQECESIATVPLQHISSLQYAADDFCQPYVEFDAIGEITHVTATSDSWYTESCLHKESQRKVHASSLSLLTVIGQTQHMRSVNTEQVRGSIVIVPLQQRSSLEYAANCFCQPYYEFACVDELTDITITIDTDQSESCMHDEVLTNEYEVTTWEVYEESVSNKKKTKRYQARVKQELRQPLMPLNRSAEPFYENPGRDLPPPIWLGARLNIQGGMPIYAPMFYSKVVFQLTQEWSRRETLASFRSVGSDEDVEYDGLHPDDRNLDEANADDLQIHIDGPGDDGLQIQIDGHDVDDDLHTQIECSEDDELEDTYMLHEGDKRRLTASSTVSVSETHGHHRRMHSSVGKHKRDDSSHLSSIGALKSVTNSPWNMEWDIAQKISTPQTTYDIEQKPVKSSKKKKGPKWKQKKSKDATVALWAVDWTKGGPNLASNEKKIIPQGGAGGVNTAIAEESTGNILSKRNSSVVPESGGTTPTRGSSLGVEPSPPRKSSRNVDLIVDLPPADPRKPSRNRHINTSIAEESTGNVSKRNSSVVPVSGGTTPTRGSSLGVEPSPPRKSSRNVDLNVDLPPAATRKPSRNLHINPQTEVKRSRKDLKR